MSIRLSRRLAGLLPLFALLVSAGGARAAVTTTVRFDYTGAPQTFVVPAGVSSIHVVAVGARGGDGGSGLIAGGLGALARADLAVGVGDTLTVRVGGSGGDGALTTAGVAGFNGGGAGGAGDGVAGGGAGGGGGGSTDLRTGVSLASRVIVAAGGGGAGSDGGVAATAGTGGAAGVAGGPGTAASSNGGGGGPGAAAGGAGGTAPATCSAGAVGVSGVGGGGGAAPPVGTAGGAGGGGGGGLFGGGGGGAGCSGGAGAGGGGGGSFVSAAADHGAVSLDTTAVPSLTITYSGPGPAAQLDHASLAFATQAQSTVSAPKTLTVTNTGSGPLSVLGVTFTGAAADDYFVDSSGCLAAVAPAASCTLAVRFAPQGQGTRGAQLSLVDNTAGSPELVTLTGSGGPLPGGATGATGATGPQGGPGPAGPAGPAGANRSLAVVLAASSLTAKANSALSVRYASTLAATVTVQVLKGRKIVLHSRLNAKRGRNSARIAHVPKTGGRYTVKLIAIAGGQLATDQITLAVRAKKKTTHPGSGGGGGGTVGGGTG